MSLLIQSRQLQQLRLFMLTRTAMYCPLSMGDNKAVILPVVGATVTDGEVVAALQLSRRRHLHPLLRAVSRHQLQARKVEALHTQLRVALKLQLHHQIQLHKAHKAPCLLTLLRHPLLPHHLAVGLLAPQAMVSLTLHTAATVPARLKIRSTRILTPSAVTATYASTAQTAIKPRPFFKQLLQRA